MSQGSTSAARTDEGAPPFLRLFGRYLRDQGLPVTSQREAVARVVFESDDHLSVDDIESALRETGERIGKATIYRTLDLLVRSRLVEEHDFGVASSDTSIVSRTIPCTST